jgi:uncharacterized protein (TIGR02996 family)
VDQLQLRDARGKPWLGEEGFLRSILDRPGDDTPRLVYADWLEERADPRGAFLRAECALAAMAKDDSRRPSAEARLQELRAGIDAGWLALLGRPPIENCGIRFKFRCPRQWQALTLTDDSKVRFCSACAKNVYYSETVDEARDHAQSGHCVAVAPGLPRTPGDIAPVQYVTLGILLPDEEVDSPFAEGDSVTILTGRFQGMRGAVERIRLRRRRVIVAVEISGRRMLVDLGYEDVQLLR